MEAQPVSWVLIDDGFHRSDAWLRASDAASRVWVDSMSYCADRPDPTNFITEAQARSIVLGLGKKLAVIKEMTAPEIGAWEVTEGGYLVKGFKLTTPKSSTDRVRRWRETHANGTDPDDSPPRGTGKPANVTPGNGDVTRYETAGERPATNRESPPVTPRNAPRARVPNSDNQDRVTYYSPPNPPLRLLRPEDAPHAGHRLAAAIGGFMAGGSVSPSDVDRLRDWPAEFPALLEGGDQAVVETCRRMAEDAVGRGQSVRTVRYFERRLADQNAQQIRGDQPASRTNWRSGRPNQDRPRHVIPPGDLADYEAASRRGSQ